MCRHWSTLLGLRVVHGKIVQTAKVVLPQILEMQLQLLHAQRLFWMARQKLAKMQVTASTRLATWWV
jgi:hypothetical protein